MTDDGSHGTPSWVGKPPAQMTRDERNAWAKVLGKAARAVGRITGRKRPGDTVKVVIMTSYPESTYLAQWPVKRGEYAYCPQSPAGTIPAGFYPIVAIGDGGYRGALRWCYPNGNMSGIDPDAWQRD